MVFEFIVDGQGGVWQVLLVMNANKLKEIMTTSELMEVNETQTCHFAFSRMEGKSFKGNAATLVCNYFGKVLGQWICIESGELDAKWKCEWA